MNQYPISGQELAARPRQRWPALGFKRRIGTSRMLRQAVNWLQEAKGAGYEARKRFDVIVTSNPLIPILLGREVGLQPLHPRVLPRQAVLSAARRRQIQRLGGELGAQRQPPARTRSHPLCTHQDRPVALAAQSQFTTTHDETAGTIGYRREKYIHRRPPA